MNRDDDLLEQWLEQRRRSREARSRCLRQESGRPGTLIILLVKLRLFWPTARVLLWASGRLLHLIARLHFLGMLPPRMTRWLLYLSGRPAEWSLALMRSRQRRRQ